MKKIILTISALAIILTTSKAQDKAFEKGNITVDLGIGFGIYGTKIHSEHTSNVISWNGTQFVSTPTRIKKDTTDGAGSVIYPIKVEYGITNWLGIGARLAYSNYFEERDSITGIKPKVSSFDAGIVANFHLVKTKRFDMPISMTLGYSHFKYLSNDNLSSKGVDNGINYGISLLPRIYFGNHIGMFFNVGWAGYKYPSIHFSNSNDSNLNDDNNQDWKYSIKGNGMNIGIGIIGKF